MTLAGEAEGESNRGRTKRRESLLFVRILEKAESFDPYAQQGLRSQKGLVRVSTLTLALGRQGSTYLEIRV